MNKSNLNPATGWRKAVNVRKRNLFQRMKAWKRHSKIAAYRLDGQAVMF